MLQTNRHAIIMNKKILKDQVETIRQAFGYIHRFKGETFVIKIDSALITHTSFPMLVNDIVQLHQMGIRIVIVPGTQHRIDEVLKQFNVKYAYKEGIRISTPESIPFIKMAAFDISNQVMTLLSENDANGIIGNWVRARSIGVRDGIDFQFSGRVDNLNIPMLRKVLSDDMIPIFPNIGWNSSGKPYNISSNELALAISKGLGASKLFFLTDFGGISSKNIVIPPEMYTTSEGTISQLTITEAKTLIDNNVSQKNNRSLELASLGYDACKSGVKRIHIINGKADGMLLKEIFSNLGFGTMIYSNQHENIRAMIHSDIPFISKIMEEAINKDILIPRSKEYLTEKHSDFVVYEVDGTTHGCGALHKYQKNTAEIAAIAVDSAYAKMGIGKKIVSCLIEKATKAKTKKLFVLTTQTSDWFLSLGFTEGTLDDLPDIKKESYNKKRNSRILIYGDM